MFKVGDLVRFTNRGHTSYRKYANLVGVVKEVDNIAKYNRGSRLEYLGAKVTVQFGDEAPKAFTEYSLKLTEFSKLVQIASA